VTHRNEPIGVLPRADAPRVRRRIRLPIILRNGRCVAASAASFTGLGDDLEHLALIFDRPARHESADTTSRVRLHSECLTGDVFGSARCDCGPQLREAVEAMAQHGGIILYLRQEGRGIGLYNKLDAYGLQDRGLDTFAANRELLFADDLRDYGTAAAMLTALNVSRIRLITNNPHKAWQLARHGISVVEVIATDAHVNAHNVAYLSAKRDRAGHYIDLPDASFTRKVR
jgi:GTP cyclohydrolase II